jgi:nitrile hydratase
MGGMEGLGAIGYERDEPIFRAPWEARALAVTLAMGAWSKWNIDASRHQRELIPGPRYLRFSYYERWIEALGQLMVKAGLVTEGELADGHPATGVPKNSPALTAERVAPMLRRGGSTVRDVPATRRFVVGDAVRARKINPAGHTRLPRYARGCAGTIARVHGIHVFPDSNAHFQGEQPQYLYSVRFAGRELWGDRAGPRDVVYIDLWDSHLEAG